MTDEHTAKFEVGDILYLALTLVVAGLGIAFGLNVLSETKTDMCDEATATYDATDDRCENSTGGTLGVTPYPAQLNATKDAVTGVSKFTDKMGLIATVIVASIVIGVLVRYLFMRPR